ncbi:hypothetical protein BH11BAC2_BH11BAC2_24470 [soil metagenome]
MELHHRNHTASLIRDIYLSIVLLILAGLLGYAFYKGGILTTIVFASLPFGIAFVSLILAKPKFGLWAMLIFSFLANGITRYIDGPFGLGVDIILLITALGVMFRVKKDELSPKVWNGLTISVLIWFAYTVLQIFNPEARSFEAWFYAVRGVSLYFIATVPLTFILLYKEKDCDTFIRIWLTLSVIATFWGMRQLYFGLDAAENRWMESGAKITHLLFGKLRVFSFYSDAGQFGAAQGHAAVIAGIMALGPVSRRKKIFYSIVFLLSFYGMMISGTRGALFVVITGFGSYLLLSNKTKILVPGILAGILFIGILKFTSIGQNNDQIRRMRTALDPNDASLQARLENQAKLKTYLSSRPLGGGIGSAGSWGQRFSPGTFLANTPLDSWYVKIWAESGVVGLLIYLGMILFILINRFLYLFKLKDPELKFKMAALYCGIFGVCFASYGNQIFGQFPTGSVMYLSMVYIFLAGNFETQRTLNKTDESVAT